MILSNPQKLICHKTQQNQMKPEINNEWHISFLQSSPLGIQHVYSSEFFHWLKHLLNKLHSLISLNVLHSLKYYLEMNFQISQQENVVRIIGEKYFLKRYRDQRWEMSPCHSG